MADQSADQVYGFQVAELKRVIASVKYWESVLRNTIPAQRARGVTPYFSVYARCLSALYFGATCAGKIVVHNSDGTYTDGDQSPVTLIPDFVSGYFPAGSRVEVRCTDDFTQMTAHGPGFPYLTGQLKSDLTLGTSSLLTLDKKKHKEWTDKTITVVGRWGSAKANETIGCLWNEGLSQWEGALAACSPIINYPSSGS